MLTEYERMEQFAFDHNIKIITGSLPDELSGYYYSNSKHNLVAITLNKNLKTTAEKTCTMAEELGHYFSTPFDLFGPNDLLDKYEKKARWKAAKILISIDKLIKAKYDGVQNKYELAEYLNVTEEFLEQSLDLFKEYYGSCFRYNEYLINFDPLNIKKTV